MGKKQKCQSCTSGWCKNHIFQLLPINSQVYFRKKLKIRLCPKLNKNTTYFENTLPMVNRDRKHYTPCFILQEEQKYYTENDEKLVQSHNLKIEQEKVQEQTIVVTIFHLKNRCIYFCCILFSGQPNMVEKKIIVLCVKANTKITWNIWNSSTIKKI